MNLMAKAEKIVNQEQDNDELEITPTQAQMELKEKKIMANWNRIGIQVLKVIFMAKEEQKRKAAQEGVAQMMHRLYGPVNPEPTAPPGKTKSKRKDVSELDSGIGAPLPRSQAGPFPEEVNKCLHPYYCMTRHGNQTNQSWRCTQCGGRWERLRTLKGEMALDTTGQMQSNLMEARTPLDKIDFMMPPICVECEVTCMSKSLASNQKYWGCRNFPACQESYQIDVSYQSQIADGSFKEGQAARRTNTTRVTPRDTALWKIVENPELRNSTAGKTLTQEQAEAISQIIDRFPAYAQKHNLKSVMKKFVPDKSEVRKAMEENFKRYMNSIHKHKPASSSLAAAESKAAEETPIPLPASLRSPSPSKRNLEKTEPVNMDISN